MRKKLIIVFLVLCNCVFGGSKENDLIAINAGEFYAGKNESILKSDNRVYKSKGTLYLPNCKALEDNNSDENFSQLSYLGDFDKKHSIKVLKKTLYNGNEYIIIDTKNNCKQIMLLGRPHVFDSFIINFNDSETTDSKKIIEIWAVSEFQIIKKRDFILQADMFFVEVRINHQSKALLLKDNRGRFWKILF
jgi:hypothetical protein